MPETKANVQGFTRIKVYESRSYIQVKQGRERAHCRNPCGEGKNRIRNADNCSFPARKSLNTLPRVHAAYRMKRACTEILYLARRVAVRKGSGRGRKLQEACN